MSAIDVVRDWKDNKGFPYYPEDRKWRDDEFNKLMSFDSHIILILDSVPDFLTNNLPFPKIIFFAFLIASLHFLELITDLSSTKIFSNI